MKKGSHKALGKMTYGNETNQGAWSFEKTLGYKVNIIEVGIIVKMPANLLTHKFLIHQMPHSKKTIYCINLDTMIFLKIYKFIDVESKHVCPKSW